jgi:hypothetical protein
VVPRGYYVARRKWNLYTGSKQFQTSWNRCNPGTYTRPGTAVLSGSSINFSSRTTPIPEPVTP